MTYPLEDDEDIPPPNPPRAPRPRFQPDEDDDPLADVPEDIRDSLRTGQNTFRPASKKNRSASRSQRPSQPRREPDFESHSTKSPPAGPSLFERVLFGRVSSAQLATFCRQAASYLSAGVALLKTLQQLRKQFARTALGPVLERVENAIRQGDSLSEAFQNEPKTFDALFRGMIQAAEARGAVPETLRMLADTYEARTRLIRQARSALIYPVIVISLSIAVVLFLALFVLPAMLKGLEARADSLPGPTQFLIAFVNFLQSAGWWLLPALLIGVPLALNRWYQTHAGKRVLDELIMRIPVIGGLLQLIDTARLARTLAALFDAGVGIDSSLTLAADVLHLRPLAGAVDDARQQITDGADLSTAFAGTRRFSSEFLAVIESGEETGKIGETLNHYADDCEERIEHTVKNLGSLIQPLIVIILGGIVLFIAIAFILAYISMFQAASRI